MPERSAVEIRASVESHRRELARSLDRLQVEVSRVADWRRQLREHQQQAIIGAAVAGFVVGGGIAAFTGLFRRRR
jgi:C4-dicarboxylate-specific signal transduction histidine kinase